MVRFGADHRSRSVTIRIIILGISRKIYSLKVVERTWRTEVCRHRCCWCGTLGCFTRHGRYKKYLYEQLIGILRVRCKCCARTHALIPEFSIPWSSFGADEVHSYLSSRAAGASRAAASTVLSKQGLHERYARWLDRRLEVVVSRGKALWPHGGELHAHGLAWIASLVGASNEPVVALNRYALENGVNCLWFSRRRGSVSRRHSAGSSGFT